MTTYWFRPKRVGWGATPSSWQGWLFTVVLLAALFACSELARRTAPEDVFDIRAAAPFWSAVLCGLVILSGGVWISLRKTEGAQRRRGEK